MLDLCPRYELSQLERIEQQDRASDDTPHSHHHDQETRGVFLEDEGQAQDHLEATEGDRLPSPSNHRRLVVVERTEQAKHT